MSLNKTIVWVADWTLSLVALSPVPELKEDAQQPTKPVPLLHKALTVLEHEQDAQNVRHWEKEGWERG